jgi:cytidyltransferase-like protein
MSDKHKIAVVSGGFDPLHSGHIEYINKARSYGDELIVCLNSDNWLIKKKGKNFLPFNERKVILENLKSVSQVISFDDSDGSARAGLECIAEKYPNSEIFFCNGGDRDKNSIPEKNIPRIKFIFEVGGNKKLNSSSTILDNWTTQIIKRRWGLYKIIYHEKLREKSVKVKVLDVKAGSGMSFQLHQHRSELWFIFSGACNVRYSKNDPEDFDNILLKTGDFLYIPQGSWHQIRNEFKEDCQIIEIQFGNKVLEEDIKRLYYFVDS